MSRPNRWDPHELLNRSPGLKVPLLIPTVRAVVPFPRHTGLLPVRAR